MIIGNYAKPDRDYFEYATARFSDSGVVIVARPGPWGAFAAYNVITGTMIWSRNGAENPGLHTLYTPLLANGGKLLVFVSTRTYYAAEYGLPGITASASTTSNWRIDSFDQISSIAQLFPIGATYYEVLDILTGDRLGARSLDLGVIEHQIAVPSGAAVLYTAPEEDGVPPDDWPGPEGHPPMVVSKPRETLRHEGTRGWQEFLFTGGWYHVPGSGFFKRWRFTDHEDVYPGELFVWQWFFIPSVMVPCATPIPPGHSIHKCCVSADGSALIFAPNQSPGYGGDGVNPTIQVMIGGEIVDAPLGAPHTPGHEQYARAVVWGDPDHLLEDLWEVSVGICYDVSRPIASGSQVILSWVDVSDLDEQIYRVRRLSVADGSTVAEAVLPAAGASPVAMTTARYLLDDGSRILNLPG